MLAVTAGAFLLATWVATKALFFFLKSHLKTDWQRHVLASSSYPSWESSLRQVRERRRTSGDQQPPSMSIGVPNKALVPVEVLAARTELKHQIVAAQMVAIAPKRRSLQKVTHLVRQGPGAADMLKSSNRHIFLRVVASVCCLPE